MLSSPPDIKIGSIIKLRERLWRVDSIFNEIIEVTPLNGSQISRRFFIPLENISIGKLSAPRTDIIGNLVAQQLMLRAFRLSMIHGSAPLLSLQRSRVIPEAFQMVPVIMSLEMPRVRMLLADDVGLGKTIEAGLILTELFARKRAKNLLVICPANLREQWRETLSYYFHFNTEIISSNHRRSLERRLPPGSDPWDHFPFLITSMDYAKEAENKAQILDRKWDLVIIDEAHNLAKPHQINDGHKIEMARWSLAKEISKRCEHLILITATPHNGYTDTFCSLLSMLNIDAISGPETNPILNKEIAKKHVCQRRRQDVENELKDLREDKSPFPQRDADEIIIELSQLEIDTISKISELGKHIMSAVSKESSHKQTIAKWLIIHFHKRALSSPRALTRSLENRLKKITKEMDDGIISEEPGIKEEEAKDTVFDNDPGERISEEIAGFHLEGIPFGNKDAVLTEKQLIEETLNLSRKITYTRDSKMHYLLSNTLRALIRTRSKALIFTKYKDTLDYLAEQIPSHRNFHGIPIVTIYGGLDETKRKEQLKKFENYEKAIMIATDVISEGLNLEHLVSQIIHYELPWNPNRLEQRNGRIDRYGQPQKTVIIRTMVVVDPLEAAILETLILKSNTIRKDYGFSPPFFGDETSILDIIREQGININLGQTKLDAFCKETKDITFNNPLSKKVIEKIKDESFYGQSTIDLSEVKQRMRNSENLIGNREEIEKFVNSGLNKFGCTYSKIRENIYKITINDSRLLRNYNNTVIECTFDPSFGKNNDNIEVLDLGHPLIHNMITMVKELTFNNEKNYGRTACAATDEVRTITAVYTFIIRYSVGTKPVSIIEELLTIGSEVYSDVTVMDNLILANIQNSRPEILQRPITAIVADLKIALSKDYDSLVLIKANQRRQELISERKKFKENFPKHNLEWIEGIDSLNIASTDLLSITIYYPK